MVLDTDDPPGLAEFYTTLLGWQVRAPRTTGSPSRRTGARIAFQLALNHQPPTWPDDTVPQQFHIDFAVDDLPAAAAYAESIGARPVEGPDQSPELHRLPRPERAPVLPVPS